MSELTSNNYLDFSINNGCLSSDTEENTSSGENSSIINYESIEGIFNYEPTKEDPINEKDLYFAPDKKDTKCSERQKDNKFIVTEGTKQNTQMMKKKRGKPSALNTNKIHDKFSFDNLMRKIKNHSLSLIVPFLNVILIVLDIKGEFFQLSYEFKKKIKTSYFYELKKETLGDIICNKISPKYKHDENENIILFKKLEKHEVLKNIFKMEYITFFKRYYMESKKCINLKVFGLEKEIILPEKCKMYNDLIESIKKSKDEDNENYIKSIKKCIDKHYISKNLFKTNK
jgi:hypothetical protein